jgi:hypothetical protein
MIFVLGFLGIFIPILAYANNNNRLLVENQGQARFLRKSLLAWFQACDIFWECGSGKGTITLLQLK